MRKGRLRRITATLLAAIMLFAPGFAGANMERVRAEDGIVGEQENQAGEIQEEVTSETEKIEMAETDEEGKADEDPSVGSVEEEALTNGTKEEVPENESEVVGEPDIGKTEEKEVSEEAGTNSKEEKLTLPMLTGMRVNTPDGTGNISNITTPFNFEVVVDVKAPEGMEVSGISLGYYLNGKYATSYTKWHGDWKPGVSGGTQKIAIDISKYAGTGDFQLQTISLNSLGFSIGYEREENNTFVGRLYGGIVPQIKYKFEYDECADYTVVTSEQEDKEIPRITEISVATNPVETNGEVQISVGYIEQGSGIKSISGYFETMNGTREHFYESFYAEGQQVGSGIINITSVMERKLDEEYILHSLNISDFAGHDAAYYLNMAEDTYLTSSDNYNEYKIPRISYTVEKEYIAPYLIVEGISIEDGVDRNNVAAGDAFNMVLKLKNNTESNATIYPQECYLGVSGQISREKGKGESYIIAPGEEGELALPVQINKFASANQESWSSVDLVYDDTTGKKRIEYRNMGKVNIQGKYYDPNDESKNKEFVGFTYDRAADFTITKADMADNEAPYIQSISAVTESIKAPGFVDFEVRVDEGHAKLERLSLDFVDAERPANRFHVSATMEEGDGLGKIYYSKEKKCYILRAALDDTTIASEYRAVGVWIYDENGKGRSYNGTVQDEVLQSYDSVQMPTVSLKVKESVCTDDDFDEPILKKVSVKNKNIAATDVAEVIVEAEDDSGVSGVELGYQLENGSLFRMMATEYTKVGNVYTYQVEFGEHSRSGNYYLVELRVFDNSARKWPNYSYYLRNPEEFVSVSDGTTVKYNGEADLTITSDSQMMHVNSHDEDIEEALNGAKDQQLVIIEGRGNKVFLEPEVLKVIKEKKLKVILKDLYSGSEVIVDGTELTEEMVANKASLVFSEADYYAYDDGATLDFGNAYDESFCAFWLDGQNWDIPSKMKLKIDKEFYTRYKDSNIRLSRAKNTGPSGSREIIQENLQFDAEGRYIIINGRGLTGGEYCVSAGTTKLFEHPLNISMEPKMVSDTVTKGKSFEANITVANNNSTDAKEVAVFPTMWDAFGDEKIEFADFACITETEGVEWVDGVGAVIKTLKAGQTVQLTFQFTIPETISQDRVQLSMHASSVDGNEQLIDYGDDYHTFDLMEYSEILKGDVNLDGVVELSDLMQMLQAVSKYVGAETLTEEQIKAGDVADDDGQLTMSDLVKLLQFISKRNVTLE